MTQQTTRLMILYTGGTFGMEPDPRSGARFLIPRLSAAKLKTRLHRQVPEMKQIAQCDVEIVSNVDSAHMGSEAWLKLAQILRGHEKNYDGFVILHGTDTLAYTASALHFLLSQFSRPIIITGAQRPLATLRSDARQNLISSLEIAATAPRPLGNRVMVFFESELFLGLTVRKRSASDYSAFESPRFPALAHVGSSIEWTQTFRELKSAKSSTRTLLPRFSNKVACLSITPGFPSHSYSREWMGSLDGLLLTLFPSGTGPTHDPEFIAFLRRAHACGLPIVTVTERFGAPGAGDRYPAGSPFEAEGACSGGSLTPECAYVLTSLILGQPQGKKRFSSIWKTAVPI